MTSNLYTSSPGGLQEASRRYPSNGVDYPLHFFNMLHFQRPKLLSEIFKWCTILSESCGLLDRITDTLSRYPITYIKVTGDSGENKSFWSDLLNNTLNMREELVKNGKNYYSFGNSISSIVPPFKRYLVCEKCGHHLRHQINDDNLGGNFKWKFHDWKFIGDCLNEGCKHKGVMKLKDVYLEGEEFAKNVRIQRWPITHIKVRDVSVAGKKKFFYRIEEKYKKGIISSDKLIVAHVPETFILACKQNSKTPIVELVNELTFHMMYESATEPEHEGLAKPFFFSAWKDIFMSFVLRKAQECIASDHLLPFRFIFPSQSLDGRGPLGNIDGAAWKQTLTTQLKRMQNDPNEVGITPFPLGYQALGGQGKQLSLVQEIEMQDRRILVQLGIPPELIYGGMTWSGSNVSLRMLENLLLYYVNKQNAFLNHFVQYVAKHSGKEAPSAIELTPFKMADDIQQIQTLLTLGVQGRISETTALSGVGNGINLEKEAEQMEKDADAMERIVKARQRLQAAAQMAVSEFNQKRQIEMNAQGQVDQNDLSQSAASTLVNGIIMQTTQGIINKMNTMSAAEKQQVLNELQAKDPQKYQEIANALMGGLTQSLPEVKPPVRGPEKAKI